MTRQEVLSDLVGTRNWRLGAELGVHVGQTLFHLLEKHESLRMVGVDHWGPRPRMDTEANFRAVAARADKSYTDRCRIIRGDTAEAAARFDNHMFDFVFVDADHSRVAVMRDLRAWAPKVKPGGAMTGHDSDLQSVRDGLEEVVGKRWLPFPAKVWVWNV